MTGLLGVSVLSFDDCLECRVRSKFGCPIGQLNVSSYVCESLVLPTRTLSQDGRTRDVQMERMRRSGGRLTNDARDNVPPGLVNGREASNRYTKMHSHNREFVRVHQFGWIRSAFGKRWVCCAHDLASLWHETIQFFLSHPILTLDCLFIVPPQGGIDCRPSQPTVLWKDQGSDKLTPPL